MAGEEDEHAVIRPNLPKLIPEHGLDAGLGGFSIEESDNVVLWEALSEQRLLHGSRVVDGVAKFGDPRMLVVVDSDDNRPGFGVETACGRVRLREAGPGKEHKRRTQQRRERYPGRDPAKLLGTHRASAPGESRRSATV